ncbi:MAG: DUF808 family protein [Candidatus Methylumidiphilus sp.]
MAGAILLALIDDIASVIDNVALMTKIAAKKTAGVLGDDLALNAHQVSGVRGTGRTRTAGGLGGGGRFAEDQADPDAVRPGEKRLASVAGTPPLQLGSLYLWLKGLPVRFVQNRPLRPSPIAVIKASESARRTKACPPCVHVRQDVR